MMNDQGVENHLLSYSDIKEPHKHLVEKHSSPKKSNVLCFNPDGSLCIPADMKDKLVQKNVKNNSSKLCLSRNRMKQDESSAGNDDEEVKEHSPKENLTPQSRKRKKSAVPVYKPPEGSCNFCHSKEESKMLGELRINDDGIRAHYNCMLFSSGLCQAGNNEEGMWGFLVPDIKKELSRGKRLKCTYCKLPGALIGCHKARCMRTYHLTCGIENNCLLQFYDSFRSFCSSHRPLQYFLKEHIGQKLDCPICCDVIEVEGKVVPQDILVTECCNLTPVHRMCIQNQADASGYFFRCPMCNNEKKYNSIMKIMGINIPQSDAVWEKEGYFDELLEEYWRCDVPICLNSEGRKADSMQRDKWDLMKCSTCGQAGAHPACLGYEKRGPKDWNCRDCLEIMARFEEDNRKKAALEKDKSPEEQSEGNTAAALSNDLPQDVDLAGTSSQKPEIEISKVITPKKGRGKYCRKRHYRKKLIPSQDPFLMTPELLKEAVFKLCVAKLKKTKVLNKNIDPDKWTNGITHLLENVEEDEEEESIENSLYGHLKPRKLEIKLKKEQYSPPQNAEAQTLSDYESDPEVMINTRKEEQWQLMLKSREELEKKNKSIKNQKTLNQFFKPKSEKINDQEFKSPENKKRRVTGESMALLSPASTRSSPGGSTSNTGNSSSPRLKLYISPKVRVKCEMGDEATGSGFLTPSSVKSSPGRSVDKLTSSSPSLKLCITPKSRQPARIKSEIDHPSSGFLSPTSVSASPYSSTVNAGKLISPKMKICITPKGKERVRSNSGPKALPSTVFNKAPSSPMSKKTSPGSNTKSPLSKRKLCDKPSAGRSLLSLLVKDKPTDKQKKQGDVELPKSEQIEQPARADTCLVLEELDVSDDHVWTDIEKITLLEYCKEHHTLFSKRANHEKFQNFYKEHNIFPKDALKQWKCLRTRYRMEKRANRNNWRFYKYLTFLEEEPELANEEDDAAEDPLSSVCPAIDSKPKEGDDTTANGGDHMTSDERVTRDSDQMLSDDESAADERVWTDEENFALLEYCKEHHKILAKRASHQMFNGFARDNKIPTQCALTQWKVLRRRYNSIKRTKVKHTSWKYYNFLKFLEEDPAVIEYDKDSDYMPSDDESGAKNNHDWTDEQNFALLEYCKKRYKTLVRRTSTQMFIRFGSEHKIPAKCALGQWKALCRRYNNIKCRNTNYTSWKFYNSLTFLDEDSESVADVTEDVSWSKTNSKKTSNAANNKESLQNVPNSEDCSLSDADFEEIKEQKFVLVISDDEENNNVVTNDKTEPKDVKQGTSNKKSKKTGPVSCPECNKDFTSQELLAKHKTQMRVFCIHCQRNFPNLTALRIHQSNLTIPKKICPLCKVKLYCPVTRPRRVVSNHIQNFHLPKWKEYTCVLCDVSVKYFRKIEEHLSRAHGIAKDKCLSYVVYTNYSCLYDI